MCFLVGATGPGVTSSGEAILGSVSDDPYLFRTFVRVQQPKPSEQKAERPHLCHLGTELCYATRGPGVPAWIEDLPPPFEVQPGQPSRGVNAAGLAFTCALAIERPAPGNARSSTITFAELSSRMMTECRNVGEAVEMLLGAGTVQPAMSVLLADADGGLAQVEVGGFGAAVHKRYSKENPGVVIAVNCYQCEEFVEFNKDEAQLHHDSNNNGARLRRGWALVQSHMGRLDVSTFACILSDHNNADVDCATNPLLPWWGYSICNHGTKRQAEYSVSIPPWGTVSAEILQPSRFALHYCYGWPCGHEPECSDQLFQSNSWGRFEAFALPASINSIDAHGRTEEVWQCTTLDGLVTNTGDLFRLRAVSHLGA
eukprot:TRINITY_DN45604_c0_g1_i1.p1 TRINITY_DN45604_c0_g1~~TRINITY_DN45604_c0_g1_i1.p1  ORF type:complete len:386 (-),score=34.96 TRINITY_DN45604_c0_g1_i1:321-1430(-)